MSMPAMPNDASVSVAALRKVASIAQQSAAAAAKTAARRAGWPRIPTTTSSATAPPNTSTADSHSAVSGAGLPPEGSAAVRNTARDAQTINAAAQAARTTSW
jgi:hypothetical protein